MPERAGPVGGSVFSDAVSIMLISVIIPYRDAARYIARCVESLYKQTGEFEFIFVNDNSSDQSAYEVLWRTENDTRFKFIDNQHSPGVSGARNTGIDIAGGEWITFLDVDDVMLSDAYKKFTTAIKQEPEAVIHQFNHVRYYTVNQHRITKYKNRPGRYDVPKLPHYWFGIWNKLFRSDFVKDIRFNESLQYGEDGLFVLECLSRGMYIHHGGIEITTVEHIIGDQRSLSHKKTFEDVMKQIRTYLLFMERQKDSDLRVFVAKEIARVLDKQTIQKVISDAKV